MAINTLFEVTVLQGNTPITLRMASASASAAGTQLNGYQWLPLVTKRHSTTGAWASDGILSEGSVNHGGLSFRMSSAYENENWSAYEWTGGLARIFIGEEGQPFSSYKQVFEGNVSSLDRDGVNATVGLLGPDALLDRNLLSIEYLGTGGAEGPPGLKGQLKPRAFGNCQNVEPRLVDAAKWIYQVHGYGAITGIRVYDFAQELDPAKNKGDAANYATLANLTLVPGEFATCAAEGLFRLGGATEKKVTADVTASGATTLSPIVRQLLGIAGISSAKIGTSVDAFTAPWSLYLTDQATVGEVARNAVYQGGGVLFADGTGAWQAMDYFAASTAIVLNADRSTAPLVKSVKEIPAAAPVWKVKIGYDRCWSVHSSSEISPSLSATSDEAQAAFDAAQAAKEAADQAVADAATNAIRIDSIVSDNVLDRSEKAYIEQRFGAATAERPALLAKGAATSERTAYSNAYDELKTYLESLVPAYTDGTQDTAINRAVFDQKWTNFDNAKSVYVSSLSTWDGTTGAGKPQDNATVGAPIGTNVGSIPVVDVVTKINALTAGGFTDNAVPPVPTGLTTASILSDAGVTFNASWNPVPDSAVASYIIAIKEGSGNYVEFPTTASSYSRTALTRNTLYTAKVSSVSKAGVRSGFSAEVALTTARDTVAPAAPLNVSVEPAFTTGFVSFTAPADNDVSRVQINLLKNGVAVRHVSVNVRPGMNGTATFSNLDRSTQYGVQAFAIDTSDNVSPASSTVLFTTSGGISPDDFTPGLSGFQTVTALPNPVGYKGPSLLYNQTDATLYTYSNGAWTSPTATSVVADGSITPNKLNVKLGGGNLVRNSSFEHKVRVEAPYAALGAGYGSYDNSYPNDGPTSWSVIDGGRRGGKAQRINWSSNTSSKGIFLLDDGVANNLRLLQPNRTYMFSFYAVGQGSALGSGINLAFNVFPEITPITAPAVTGDWQRWVFKLVTGPQVDTNIFLTTSYYGPNPGFMYIDDIQLEEGDVVTAYSPALLSGEITGPLLAEGAVTVGKIGDLAITETKIAPDAISAPKIQANAIEATKIATDAIETRHVRAGAIKTDELDALAVTANKIAVNAVVAEKIAAGSINVNHLLVGNMNQLNPDPGFRDTEFWFNNGVFNGALGTAAGSVPGWYNSHGPDIHALIGTTQFAMLWAGYFNSKGRQHLFSPRRKNIKGGTVYELSGFGWNSSNQAFTALIRFYNVDGIFQGDAALSWQSGETVAKAIQFTAPPGTNSYEFIVYNASGSQFADYCIISNLQVTETSGATAIQDGAITTDKIRAGSVTAAKVAANSITANHIQAGTIGAAQIATGALTARVIATGNPDNIVPDGDFRDASWWNSNTPDGRLNGIDVTFAQFRRALSITPGGGFDFFSPMFTVEPGATYKFTMAVHTIGFNGQFLATLHMPGIQWYSLKNGAACDPGIINSANGTTTNVSETYETTYTVPVGVSHFNSWQFRLNGGFTGEVQFAVKIVRVSDATLIKDGAITTNKLTVGAVTADKILAGTITGDKFNTGTSLPGTITVGNTGVAIGTTAAQAANGGPLKWYDASSGNQYNFYGSRIQRDAALSGWYSNAYTTEGFRNAAKISAVIDTPDTFFGLATGRPYNNGNDYQQINYSIHRSSNGTVYAYEYGAAYALVADAGNGIVYSIIYDGKSVSYVRDNDNATLRVVGAPAGMTVFGAVSLYSQGSAVSRVSMAGGMDNSLNGADPAARINAYSTTIDPGRVLIQGGTTLDAWRDQTEIRGGAIKTNSVSAEKIAINARGISVIGCDFEYNPVNGYLYWRDGHVLYTDDAGNPASPYIPAGSVPWGGGSYNYIMWDKGAGSFRQVVDNWEQAQVRNSNSIIMCTWRNGPSFVANYGGTIVHGDRITTRTINADRMNVNSLSAISANVGTVTAGLVRSSNGNAYFDLDNARIVFNNGSVMKVQGVGFGSANQFIEWFGPVQSSFTSCTEANATYYLKTNGSAYFGGSLSAGVLKNSVQTTSQAYDANVTTGTFGSNGKSRVITVGYQASSSTNITGQCPTPYTPYATIRLYRGTTAGGTLLAEQTFNGSHSCSPGAGQFEPGSMIDGIGGSITYTDNTGGSSASYFVQIVGRNIMTTNLAQSLGVTSVEQ